ncbi:MAG TPA: glycosyltransferase [Solirubrobacteraceae bacterium]|nr:glycosyltransferase [Solirubrobacteraceae bacterium]
MVLFVSYSGMLGGAERLLVDYAASLDRPVCLACPPGALADAASAAGLRVFPRPVRSPALRGSAAVAGRAVVDLAAHAHEIRALARGLDPDLIVAWGMRSAIAALGSGRHYLFAHNDLLPGPVVGTAVRAAAWRARCVVALSHAIADELPGGAVEILHPGVDVEAFARADRAPQQPPEVIVLGALVGWKRPDLALEALALARREVPELRLTLVGAPLEGETELVDRLRARADRPDLAGAVTLGGFEPDPRAALARATCLLHCAPREPFGLAVLEALAAARPAVVPDAAGPAEIVDASCGIRYAPGDAAAAAQALVDVVHEPAGAAAMGRRGRQRARAHFDRARARRRFAELVAGCARPRQSGAPVPPAAPSSLAIVTVTHNSERDLVALLDSVGRHVPGAEVVVVDCASTDGSLAVARAHAGVTAIALRENAGFGRACNRGVRAVGAPAVALLNPDVELIDDSLLALAGEALAPGRPPRLLAPRVLNGDGTLQDTVQPRPGSAADLVRAVVPPGAVPAGAGGTWLAPWRSARPRRVGWAVGCALVARTETLAALGPFDEDLFLYGEDLELGLHAQESGVETWLWPAARVIHHRAHATAAAFGGEPFERLARGRHDAVARRLGPGRAALDDGAQTVTFASRLALKRMLGRPAERERRQLAAVGALRRGR